jgi:hypothetical protein
LLVLLLLATSFACRATSRWLSGPQPTFIPIPAASAMPPEQGNPNETASSCEAENGAILQAADSEQPPPGDFPQVNVGNSPYIQINSFSIQGDTLSAPVFESVPQNLRKYQRELDAQRSAWALFAAMIPLDQRQMLAEFQIMTDGPGEVLSAVEQTANDPRRWILEVDIADLADTRSLAFTMLHEFGHLLTLGPAQVPPDTQVFNNPFNSRLRERHPAACSSYFPGEGCSLPNSYLNRFFNQFWTPMYDQWSLIDHIDDGEWRDEKLLGFYRQHRAQFVDSYAVSSPSEDIAETFAYYLLDPHRTGDSIADEKVRFFEDFPELVSLRNRIRSNVCKANP